MGTDRVLHRAAHVAERERFVLACIASLGIHLWLAHELPAGGGPRDAGVSPLEVRLVGAQSEAPATDSSANVVLPGDRASDPKTSGAGIAKRQDRVHASPRERDPRSHRFDGGLASDPTYYSIDELDVYPSLLAPLSLHDAASGRGAGRTGRVRATLLIDAAGRVNEVTIMASEPPDDFDEEARTALQRAVFSAARRNGLPVASRVTISVEFGTAVRAQSEAAFKEQVQPQINAGQH